MSEVPPAQVHAAPFLKWAGGKTSLLRQYAPYFPQPGSYQRYVEPFIGGGAVFFHLQAPSSRLADVNRHLIQTYTVVRDQVDELIEALAHHHNTAKHFGEVRDLDPDTLDPVTQAARFIYLNRTCYNGLYRVNRSGRFNVPFGKYSNPRICDVDRLRAASAALANTELLCADFEETAAGLGPGDFIYFDPPYAPVSATANFTDYAEEGFGEEDQRRLARVFHELDDRGCTLLLSNSSAPLIEELYRTSSDRGFPLREIKARRAISCNADTRGEVTEYLVANYALPRRKQH